MRTCVLFLAGLLAGGAATADPSQRVGGPGVVDDRDPVTIVPLLSVDRRHLATAPALTLRPRAICKGVNESRLEIPSRELRDT